MPLAPPRLEHMKRGTVSLFLIVGGAVLLTLAVLSATLFAAMPDNLGATIGFSVGGAGLLALIGGMALRWTQKR